VDVPKKRSPEDLLPVELPGESLYQKESREADVILAKQRAARKVSAKPRKPKKP
jgi:hypothetical protein